MIDKNKLILLAEDDASLLRVAQEKLIRVGYRVETAVDGDEAIDKALHLHPDLILLDILMPKMSGLDVLEQLRKDEWGKNAPVLILTNLASIESVSKALDAGALYYFIKSDHTLLELVEQIEEVLEKEDKKK